MSTLTEKFFINKIVIMDNFPLKAVIKNIWQKNINNLIKEYHTDNFFNLRPVYENSEHLGWRIIVLK